MNSQKPKIVQTAQLILYATLAVGLVRAVLEFSRMSQQAASVGGSGFVIFVQLFVLAFMGGLIFLIGKRKNWARWLFVIMFILGVPLSISPLIQSLASEPLSGVLGLGQAVAQTVALVFLFKASAREWFKKIQNTNANG